MRQLIIVAMIISTSSMIRAQNLPSVDVETANLQIEQFENENRSLENRTKLLEESIIRLEGEIELWTGWVSSIERSLELLNEQADLLKEVVSGVGSSSIVERIAQALARHDRVTLLLEAKHLELTERLEETESLIVSNRTTLAEYERRIEQNSKNIILLRSAISNSESSEARIEEYLENLDATLERALDLLVEPATEAGANANAAANAESEND